MFDRCRHSPRGRAGGSDGATGRVYLASGSEIPPKGRTPIPPGDRLILEMPGGAGYGNPHDRDPALVADDIRNGLVSFEAAKRDYGFQ